MSSSVRKYLKLFGVPDPSEFFDSFELQKFDYYLGHMHETSSTARDHRGNWDYEQAGKLFSSPFLDEMVCNRLRERGVKQFSPWPDSAPFAVLLSHDVDRTEAYSPKVFVRNLTKRAKFEKSARSRAGLLFNLFKTKAKSKLISKVEDKIWRYEVWTDLEASYGYHSTYYFFVRPHINDLAYCDCDYMLSDIMRYEGNIITVEDYIRILAARGHEIGLHGSFKTWKNEKLFANQAHSLRTASDQAVISTRQHYLHTDVSLTPKIQRSAGFLTDSSLGFTTNPGYRAGTCYPYVINTPAGEILELPLILMDVALLRKRMNDFNSILKIIDQIINQVERVGGCLTVNYHPDYVLDRAFLDSYKYILSEVQKRGAAVMTAKAIFDQINHKLEEK